MKTLSQSRGESYASSEVERLFQELGFAINKHQSHYSTESEVISLDARLRMDGIPALDLWELVIEVLHYSKKRSGIWKPIARDQRSAIGKPITQ